MDTLADDNMTSLGARTANTISFVMGGRLLTLFLGGLLLIALTRILGAGNYGMYVLAISFAGILGSFGNFGIATELNKSVSEYRHKKDDRAVSRIISEAILLVLVIGLLLSIVTFAFSGTVAIYYLHNGSMTLPLQLASIIIVVAMLSATLISALIGLNKGRQVIAVSLVLSALQVSVSISLAYLGLGANAPIIGLIIGYLGSSVASLYFLYRVDGVQLGPGISLKGIRKLFYYSFPIGLSVFFANIRPDSAALLLGAYESAVVIGNFGIALKINTLLGSIFDALTFSLLPAFTVTLTDKKITKNIDLVYNYSVYMAFLFLVPAILFLAVMAKPISYTLFTGSYSLAPTYILIISLGFVIWIIGSAASIVLIGSNRLWETVKYTLIVDLVVLLIAAPLSFIYHNTLAVITDIFLVAPVLYAFIFLIKINRLFKIKLAASRLLRVLSANLVTVFCIYLLTFVWPANFVVLLIASFILMFVLYPPFIVLFRGVSGEDIRLIEKISKKLPFVSLVARYFTSYAGLLTKWGRFA